MFSLASMRHAQSCPTTKDCRCALLRPALPGRLRERKALREHQQKKHNSKYVAFCRAAFSSRIYTTDVSTTSSKGKRKRVHRKESPPSLLKQPTDGDSKKPRSLRKDEYYASLLKLSPKFEIAALGGRSLSGNFAMLTKEPLPSADNIPVLLEEGKSHFEVSLQPLSKPDGSRKVLRLNGKNVNLKMVERYRRSFLCKTTHAESFAGAIRPEFWKKVLVLPVEMMGNSLWWGVVNQVVNPEALERLNLLMEMVAVGETGSEECASLMQEIGKGFFSQIDDVETEDPASLLQMFVMEKKGESGHLYHAEGWEEVRKSNDEQLDQEEEGEGGKKKKKKKKTKQSESSVMFRLRPLVWQALTVSDAMIPPPEGEGEQNDNEGQLVAAENIRVIPIAKEWLQLGVLTGKILPWVFNYLRAGWVKEKYNALQEISPEEVCKAVPIEKTLRQDFKRLVHMGNSVLKYVVASDRFISMNGSVSHASQGHDMILRCRIEALGKLIPWEIAKLLVGMDTRMYMPTTWDRSSYDAPLALQCANSLEYPSQELTPPLTPPLVNLVGKVTTAIAGVCYFNGGLTLVRSFCREIGFIDDGTIEFFREIEGVRMKTWTFRYEWEKKGEIGSPITKAQSRVIFKTVEESFGYRFNVWQRLGLAFRHFSKSHYRGVQFRALENLGDVAFSLILAEYIMEVMPTSSQTHINKIFNILVIQEIMGRIIGVSGVMQFLVYNRENNDDAFATAIKEFPDLNPNEVSGFKAPKIWAELFKALLGAILVDSCFNLDEVRRVMLPKVEPFLPSVLSMAIEKDGENGFLTYGQYIPTHITPTVFKSAISASTIRLHGNVVKFCSAMGSSGGGTEHGFIVLTAKKLPRFPNFEMEFTPPQDTMCNISIKPFSERPLTFTAEEMDMIEDFQWKLFEDVAVPPDTEVVPDGDFEKRYAVLPAIRGREGSNEKGKWKVDWNFTRKIINTEVSPDWDEFMEKVASGGSIGEGVLDRITCDSAFEIPPSNWPVEAEETHFASTVKDPEILRGLQSIVWRSGRNLIWAWDIGNLKKPGKEKDASTSKNVLVRGVCLNISGIWSHVATEVPASTKAFSLPEMLTNISTCKATPFSVRWFRRAAMLPSILWRMEGFLLADDFRSMYSISPKVPFDVLLTVLTVMQATDWNPERYFALGNAVVLYIVAAQIFLKNSNMAAGEMSKRQAFIVKESLVPPDSARRLAGHLISNGFYPHKRHRPWHPPGVKPFVLESTEGEGLNNWDQNKADAPMDLEKTTYDEGRVVSKAPHPVSMGMVNYHIKAVAGALYMNEGMKDATKFLQSIGIIRNARSRSKARNRRVKNPDLLKLERLIGYKFNDMTLLLEAFVHPSMPTNLDYDRLEYIGDQVLEVLVVGYILEKHPKLSLGELNTLKVATVGNENLARILMAKPYRLHRFLQHRRSKLATELKQKERLADKLADKPPGELGGQLPKVCGDLFESVVGAVLVDSGFCLETVWKVVYPMMKDYLTEWIDNPEKVLENRSLFN
ncbi:hypothetical protein BSKO_06290 [Bryopsis sp. KO-2023]|nr:hypothetical protein BSKO_06290 [Bryopsis sp. KO-2023]